MKKLLVFLLCAVILLQLAATASADSIIEPWGDENGFYNEHRDECTYDPRCYFVYSPNGDTILFDEPGGESRATADNGFLLKIYYLYQDWALGWDPQYGIGWYWVERGDLITPYGYMEEIGVITGKPQDLRWGTFGDVLYTRSAIDGETAYAVEYWELGCPEDVSPDEYLEPFILGYYTDPSGNVFGYIDSIPGGHQIRDIFICVTDPGNPNVVTPDVKPISPYEAPRETEPPAEGTEAPTEKPAEGTEVPTEKPAEKPTKPADRDEDEDREKKETKPEIHLVDEDLEKYLLPIALVCLTVALSMGLLLVFWKKKNR